MALKPMNPGLIFELGEFQIDPQARVLRREDEVLTLNRRAFDVLLYLVQNSGRVLTRDELVKNFWPDTFVDESSLTQSISVLRRALGEKPGENSCIVTLPGRGYQFVSPVTEIGVPGLGVIAAQSPSTTQADAAITTAGDDGPGAVLLRERSITTRVVTEEKEQLRPLSGKFWVMIGIGTTALVIATVAVTSYVLHLRSARRLTEKDTVVLADFANRTGDPVFDDTLKTGLSVALNQSPFLNVLSDHKVAGTLRLMSRPVGTKLTPDVVRELCQRAGSKAYIAGSISSLGSQYVVTVEAVNCQSGDTLAQEQATAPKKEKVLDALSE